MAPMESSTPVVYVKSGTNTGDTIIVDSKGREWQLVDYFPVDRSTGQQQGYTDYKRIYEK